MRGQQPLKIRCTCLQGKAHHTGCRSMKQTCDTTWKASSLLSTEDKCKNKNILTMADLPLLTPWNWCTDVLCSQSSEYDEAQDHVRWSSYGSYFFQSLSVAKKLGGGGGGGGVKYFSRLHHYRDYGNLWSVNQVRPLTRSTNGEDGLDLGKLWFADPDAHAMYHWLPNKTLSSDSTS